MKQEILMETESRIALSAITPSTMLSAAPRVLVTVFDAEVMTANDMMYLLA